MQESSVQWDPVFIHHPTPWYVRAFIVYLFLVLCISVFRAAVLAKRFRRLSKIDPAAPTEVEFRYVWNLCGEKVHGMKRAVWLTLLIAGLVLALGLLNLATAISFQKSAGIALIAGTVAETLVPLALGLFICVLLYATAAAFEGGLEKRMAEWNHRSATLKRPKNLQ